MDGRATNRWAHLRFAAYSRDKQTRHVFHSSVSRKIQPKETDGNASLDLAWSDDLLHWNWPAKS